MANLSGLACTTHNGTAFATGTMQPTDTRAVGTIDMNVPFLIRLAWDEPLLDVYGMCNGEYCKYIHKYKSSDRSTCNMNDGEQAAFKHLC
jgi:hypothetical protein